MISELSNKFEERLGEILAYLEFLDGIESIVRSGVPRIGGEIDFVVTTQHQKILYSGVYLQLYNLVESTITSCLDAVSKAATQTAQWTPGDLTNELRREWVRHIARTNIDMGADKRLEEALILCDHLVSALPVNPFDIDKGGGGNWDDTAIFKIADRIGCRLEISQDTEKKVKIKIKNNLGAMALIVYLRNKLAHGNLSFAECGQDDSVRELRALADNVAVYLREVVHQFIKYLEEHRYLRPERRPANRPPV